MASWTEILMDIITLTDEVKRLNATTEKLSSRTIDIDKRLVRLETMVEVAQMNRADEQVTAKQLRSQQKHRGNQTMDTE